MPRRENRHQTPVIEDDRPVENNDTFYKYKNEVMIFMVFICFCFVVYYVYFFSQTWKVKYLIYGTVGAVAMVLTLLGHKYSVELHSILGAPSVDFFNRSWQFFGSLVRLDPARDLGTSTGNLVDHSENNLTVQVQPAIPDRVQTVPKSTESAPCTPRHSRHLARARQNRGSLQNLPDIDC